MNLKRSPRLSILLLILIGLVAFKVYRIWEEGLPELPSPGKQKPRVTVPKERRSSLRTMRKSTANIVKKNLFDPKRGAGSGEGTELSSQEEQKNGDFVLLGTMIIGADRKALIRVLPASRGPRARGRGPRGNGKNHQMEEVRRISLGDVVGDFELAEVHPHKVILKKGAEQIELVLDFISRPRKIEKPTSAKPEAKRRASRPRGKNSRRRPRRE